MTQGIMDWLRANWIDSLDYFKPSHVDYSKAPDQFVLQHLRGNKVYQMPEVLAIERFEDSKKLTLYTYSSICDFNGSLLRIALVYKDFFFCQRNLLLNLSWVDRIDLDRSVLITKDDSEYKLSKRKLRKIVRRLNQ